MSQLPGEPPNDLLLAIGRLIAMWSFAEAQLALQVGRLAAAEPDHSAKRMAFNAHTYTFASMIARGSNARALLTQIGNFARTHKAEVKKVTEAIEKIKHTRDRVAHLAPITLDGQMVFYGGLTASRPNMGASYPYSAESLHATSIVLRGHIQRIDQIVTEHTGLGWPELRELHAQWAEHHQKAAQQIAEQWNQDSDLQASLAESASAAAPSEG